VAGQKDYSTDGLTMTAQTIQTAALPKNQITRVMIDILVMQ